MSPIEEVHNARKNLDLALQNVQETERFFLIEQLIVWLNEEKAQVRERINFDSGTFDVDEDFSFP